MRDVGDLLEDARKLNPHYIPGRYPNGLLSGYPHTFYEKETAEQALNAAHKIFNGIRDCYRTQSVVDVMMPEEE